MIGSIGGRKGSIRGSGHLSRPSIQPFKDPKRRKFTYSFDERVCDGSGGGGSSSLPRPRNITQIIESTDLSNEFVLEVDDSHYHPKSKFSPRCPDTKAGRESSTTRDQSGTGFEKNDVTTSLEEFLGLVQSERKLEKQ